MAELVCDLPRLFEAPSSPSVERALSEAFTDSALNCSPAMMKLRGEQNWLDSNDTDASPNHRISSPPPTTLTERNEMEPRKKDPIVFKAVAEAKRARRSAIEKKSRLRRQNVLKHMRDEVKHLEKVYAAMAARKDAEGSTGLVQWKDPRNLSGAASMKELQQKYSELTLVACALEEDQVALHQLLQEHKWFHRTVKTRCEEKRVEDAKTIWDSGVPPSSSFSALFRSLSLSEGYAFVRDAHEEIRTFTECNDYDTTGASFMGWTDKRKYNPDSQTLHYSFTKHFPLESTEDVFNKSWAVSLDASLVASIGFGKAIKIRQVLLQSLSDNLVIVRRDHKVPDIPVTFVAVQFHVFLKTPTGYTICVRSIPAPEIQGSLEAHEYFSETFYWMHFNRLYDEFDNVLGCEVVMAGAIKSHHQMPSKYWLFELMCTVIRWETACIAPLLLKKM